MTWKPITIDSFTVPGIRGHDGAFRVVVDVLGDLRPEWVRCFEEEALVLGLQVDVDSEEGTIELYVPDDSRGTTRKNLELAILEANETFQQRLGQHEDEDSQCKRFEDELNGR